MGTTALRLEEAIDELLDVDPADLADDELAELTVALQRQSHRFAAVRARCVEGWVRRRSWADDGSRSPGHRLAREASTPVAVGKAEVRRAASLAAMPHVAAALAAGELSPQHVDVLAAAAGGGRADRFVEHEAMLVAQCRALRFGDARRVIDYWVQHADAERAEDDGERLRESRGASAATTFQGAVDVRALLDPVGGAPFVDELDRIMEQLRVADLRDGTVRTARQRRADAMVEMAHRSRTAHTGGLRPRPLITVLVGEATLARVCELATGTVIAPGQVLPWLSQADLERVVFDGPDRVLSVSRERCFTGAVRRAVEARDRRCQHPSGCDEPASRCDVDHVVPYRHGGPTSEANGRLCCWPHNRIELLRDRHPSTPTTGHEIEPEPPPDTS